MKRFPPKLRTLCWIAVWLSVISVIIASMCCTPFDRTNGVEVLISILVAVVTIYMFIHVIDEFYIEKRIRRTIVEEQKVLKKYIDCKSANNLLIQKYYTYFFQALNEIQHTQIECALNYLFRSLDYLNKADIKDKEFLKNEIYTEIERLLKKFPATTVSENECVEYKRILFSDTINIRRVSGISALLQNLIRKPVNLKAMKEKE